mgnify:CR=1 FL=1
MNCFGQAFQISDDYLDKEQDNNRKIEDISPNYMINYGKKKTVLKVKECIVIFRNIMIELGLWSKLFNDICLYLVNRVD